jgi:hypothetical protein
MDILKPILDIYDSKKDVFLFYVDPVIRDQIEACDYVDDGHELFLNDKLYIINRATLELEHVGSIQAIKENIVTLKVKSRFSIHIDQTEYHIFIKRKHNKHNNRDFYKALLQTLE